MRFSFYLHTLLAMLGLAGSAVAATPVIVDLLTEGTVAKVAPVLPTSKTLLFPVSAYDDAGQLTITATSDNPKVFVRVKTGNPLMKFVVQQAASGSDPGFQETAVFQLFRDLAPETVSYIGGFAQGGFYDTGNSRQIFRTADFGVVPGQTGHSFIYQGGSTTAPSTRSSIGYNFDNEFSASAMFTGSGQLAMANGGYTDAQKGTNSSQYFITEGNVRQLDFKHTIFGQLTRGFGVMKKIRSAPSKALIDESGQNIGTTTLTPVEVISSSVVPQYIDGASVYTDAVLVLSATAPGTSVISVTATNAQGLSDTKTFTVTVQDDLINSRPFITQIPDAVIAPGGQANFQYRVVDLERDYVPQTLTLVNNGQETDYGRHGLKGFLGGTTNVFGTVTSIYARVSQGFIGVKANPQFLSTSGGFSFGSYKGPLYPTVTISQHDPLYRGAIDGGGPGIDNATGSTVAAGDAQLIAQGENIYGAPGVAPATPFIVARYRDTDPKAKAADNTVLINWGDGSPLYTATLSADKLKPGATSFQVSGTHTYARAGSYDVVTTVGNSTSGLHRELRGTAVISTSPLKLVGATLNLPGPTVANSILATFTDASATPAPASGYEAMVDWGDGAVTKGTVRLAGPGRFSVVGIHTYKNSDRYSLSIRLHRSGSATTDDALAWSTINWTKAYGAEHLPPFSMARLEVGVVGVPVVVPNNIQAQELYAGPVRPTRTTTGVAPFAQTYLNYGVDILNTGNRPSKPGKMRFYLSADKTVNLTASGTAPTDNPADLPVNIKDYKTNEFFLPIVQPGQVIHYYFQKSKYADLRLVPPPNENGSGYNFLVQLDYSDPLVDHLPVGKIAVAGKLSGIGVSKTLLNTSEAGGTGGSDTFNVTLDRAPSANVTVPITLGSGGAAEGTLSTNSVVFTPQNWQEVHAVTVTGKRDTVSSGATTQTDGNKTYFIAVGPSVSTLPLFDEMEGPTVRVSNADRDANLKLTSSSTTYITSESNNPATHSKTISITINRKPTADVNIAISTNQPDEVDIVIPGGGNVLKITPAEVLTVPTTRSFTITGKDDHIRDGDKDYTVSFLVTSPDVTTPSGTIPGDGQFDGLYLPPLTNKNVDDGDLVPANP